MLYLKLVALGVVTMIVLDIVWIGGLMTSFYKFHLKDFLRFDVDGSLLPRIVPTIVVYVAGAALITFFALPLVKGEVASGVSIWIAALYGALLGLLVYAFYDFTNYALFEKWTLVVSIVDVLWGSVLFYLTTVILAFL